MEAKTKGVGSPASSRPTEHGETADVVVSQSETIKVCPECGCNRLNYGTNDPCEGHAYWCAACNFGPIWSDTLLSRNGIPLHEAIARMDEPLEDIIDADEYNIRLRRGKVLRTFLHRGTGCVIEEVAN